MRRSTAVAVRQVLEDESRRFKAMVPGDPDEGLPYYTGSWNPLTMVTSSFAHGDWLHITSDVTFIFAFAATVEMLAALYIGGDKDAEHVQDALERVGLENRLR